jgi:hypothetical protein
LEVVSSFHQLLLVLAAVQLVELVQAEVLRMVAAAVVEAL